MMVLVVGCVMLTSNSSLFDVCCLSLAVRCVMFVRIAVESVVVVVLCCLLPTVFVVG